MTILTPILTLYIIPVVIILIALKFFSETLSEHDLDIERAKSVTFIPLASLALAAVIILAMTIHTFSGLSTRLVNKIIGE